MTRIMNATRCLACLGLMMAATPVRADDTLLPAPREIHYGQGVCALAPESFIWIDTSGGHRLLPIAEDVQESLRGTYGELALSASAGSHTSVEILVRPDYARRPQGYELSVSPAKIRIVAHDEAGAFYAAQTLRQMCRQATGKLRCLQVIDWPDYLHRGVMLDISRDRVPTMQTLYQLVDMLAEFKINEFQLYTQHTFAYRDHETVWKDASPMTAEQILKLDRYCRERHVELVPNQTSFGHLNRWLKHEPYRQLAEVPDGYQHSLCATDPRSIEFLEGLYDELLPNFSSRQFNVACDETFDLGSGRSKKICEQKGKGRVYLDFVKEIHRLVNSHGRTMQMWGDIVMMHPELISELPDGITVLEWGYRAEHPFDAHCEKFARAGVPFYVCPGTSTWNTVAGRTSNAMANLRNAAGNGRKHGAIGFLNTNWGDHGHTHPLSACYPGFAYGAGLSWAVDANRDMDLPSVLDRHVFRDQAGVMGTLVCDLGDTYKMSGVEVGNASILFHILTRPQADFRKGPYARLTQENLEQTLDYIDQVMTPLEMASMQAPDAELVEAELRCAASLLRHACHLGIARIAAPDKMIERIPRARCTELGAELEGIIAEYKRLWLARSRPGGLPDSVAHFSPLLNLYNEE